VELQVLRLEAWPLVRESGRGGRLESEGKKSIGDRSRAASAVAGLGGGLICKGGRRMVLVSDFFVSRGDVGGGGGCGVDDIDLDG
jgi:hypothetical protein